MTKKEEIIKLLEGMTILELNELIKEIEKHFDVKQTQMVAANSNNAASAESQNVTVSITAVGNSKVAVIKALSKLSGKGLMVVKKMLDSLPCVVEKDIEAGKAEDIKAKLVEVGATVEVK